MITALLFISGMLFGYAIAVVHCAITDKRDSDDHDDDNRY